MKHRNGADEKEILGQKSVEKLILKFALPATAALVSTSLYSLADAFFVGKLGDEASAAVGVAFVIQAVLQTVGFTLGLGGGSPVSRFLGKKDEQNASECAGCAVVWACLIGLSITAALAFVSPLMRFFGADGDTLPFAVDYAKWLLISAPVTALTFVLNQLLRAEGKALFAMSGLLIGNLCNVALDPLMIFTFGLGIAGASAATLISRIFALGILTFPYLCGKSRLNLFGNLRPSVLRRTGTVFLSGLPSLLRQGLSAVAAILTTRSARLYGKAAVTATSVTTRLFLLTFSVCLGIGQGMMPVAGYGRGAGEKERERRALLFSTYLSTAVLILFGIGLVTLAKPLIGLFSSDAETVAIGTRALRAQGAVLAVHGVVTTVNMYFQAVGKPISSSVLAGARQGFFFLPLIFLLPSFWGVNGLILVQPLADGLTFLFTLPFAVKAWKEKAD